MRGWRVVGHFDSTRATLRQSDAQLDGGIRYSVIVHQGETDVFDGEVHAMRTTGRTSTLVAALALTAVLIPQSAHADLIVFQDRVVFGLTIDSDPSLIKTVESWDTYPAGTIFPNGPAVNGITYYVSAGEALVVSTGHFAESSK